MLGDAGSGNWLEGLKQSMEIQRYMRILKDRKWVVILTTLVTLVVVALGSVSMTPTYSASTLVRVAAGFNSSDTYIDLNYTERLIQTYVQLLKSRPFLEEVIKRLSLQVRSEALADAIKVESLTGTELIKISVDSASPQQAAAIANTLAALLAEQGQQMYSGQGKSAREILQEQVTALDKQLRQDRILLASLSASTGNPIPDQETRRQDLTAKINAEEQTYAMILSQYDKARVDEAMRANSVSIAEPAIAPEAPSKPSIKLNVILGALVGLLGGIGLAFVLENLSPSIHSRDDLERTAGAPLLGCIPRFGTRARHRDKTLLLSNGSAQSPAAEAFRVLGANTSALLSKAHLKTILFSSADPKAGKSTVVANLAVAMAKAGRQVIVVDGDLRHPCMHQIFGADIAPGLSDLLLDPGRLDLAVQPTQIKYVRAIAAGSAQSGPTELLNGPAISKIMCELAKDADVVLWDSPPVLAASDAALLAPTADGVVLIVEHPQTRQESIQAACQQFVDVGANLLGIVVNRADQDGRYTYYHQRSPRGGRWSALLKGIRSVSPRAIFSGKRN